MVAWVWLGSAKYRGALNPSCNPILGLHAACLAHGDEDHFAFGPSLVRWTRLLPCGLAEWRTWGLLDS